MSDTEASLAQAAAHRPPIYRDATALKWIAQVGTLAVVVFLIWFLANQASTNIAASDQPTGYDFLNVNPGIQLSGGIDDNPATGGRALWVGMVNTLRVSVAGIFFATMLGIVVGVARLSQNWVVNRVAGVFIEYMRNIPLLVHIILFSTIIGGLGTLTKDVGPINGWIHISQKGFGFPRVHPADGFYQWMIFILVGAAIGRIVKRRRQHLQDSTGAETYPWGSFFAVVAAFGIVGWFLHPIFGFMGGIFDAIAGIIDSIPETAVRIALSALALAVPVLWIRQFLDSRRTPAGLAKLTDDDWFRMIFAGVAGLIGLVFLWIVWPGGSSWLVNSSRDLFEVIADKFGDGRGSWRNDPPIDAQRPTVVQPGLIANAGDTGLEFSRGLAAIFFGVVLYTAAFIAEIVRGGILAVPKGQTEAAQAVGLRRTTMLRRVILPQAFRISLPPLGNQYLNLTKNTSLAIAVGYTDLVQVGQTIYNQTGKTLEVFSIWMGFYLACSLTISVVVNYFNVRLKIVER